MKKAASWMILFIPLAFSCKDEAQKEYAAPERSEGKAQSPVDIVSENAEPDQAESVTADLHGSFTKAENLGHTVELVCKDGSTAIIEGKRCTVQQLHFHTPSEHLIDGVTYPMEMHIVSTVNDSSGSDKDTKYFVIGVLFKMGKENHFISEFERLIPTEEGDHVLDSGAVSLQDLLTLIDTDRPLSCYTYNGSLTTPPYSETVNWIVLNHPIEASTEQIMTIEKIEGNNARHVQALNDRRIAIH